MTWLLVIGSGWLLLGTLIAVLIGRSVRLADALTVHGSTESANFVVDPDVHPGMFTGPTVLRWPPITPDQPASPPQRRDSPTVPGIPAARPPVPGAGRGGGEADPERKSGLA